jgi:NAD(P)-dependent dehydrogenase (short-subunit alcohol dehydrogenase family)
MSAQSRPIALITGANKGIGFAVAEQLGHQGYTVLIGSRDRARGEAAAATLQGHGVDAHAIELAVDHDESVATATRSIAERYSHLDALVNNAAVKLENVPAPPSECELDTVRATFETNVFGVIRVTTAMLGLLRRSLAPRIVNVSSGMGSLTLAATDPHYMSRPLLSYSAAKAALNSVTLQFANELRHTPFKVNAADPGFTNTDMVKGVLRQTSRMAAEAAVVIVNLATAGPDGPTGGFFDENGPVPW